MPRISVEPQRRRDLLAATIIEIGRVGSLDVTVGQIAKRAGVSSALAHHYFGSKERIFLAAMRSVLAAYAGEVRDHLRGLSDPRARVDAIVAASFTAPNFSADTISTWLNFYVLARTSPEARHLLTLYHRRLHSNLVHALRPLAGDGAGRVAEQVAALIDGLYLRRALGADPVDQIAATALVAGLLDTIPTASTHTRAAP